MSSCFLTRHPDFWQDIPKNLHGRCQLLVGEIRGGAEAEGVIALSPLG
jgi:hypothetical protein